MRKVFVPAALSLAAVLSACGGGERGAATSGGASDNRRAAAEARPEANTNRGEIGVVSSHGGAAAPAATPAAGGQGDAERGLVETAELDKRVRDAAAKAKAPGATESEKRAAADAYVARGNVYYNAGQPRLYKYALADFKQALRYQPGNGEAQEKIDMIVSIYQSLGRPVPEVPEEQ